MKNKKSKKIKFVKKIKPMVLSDKTIKDSLVREFILFGNLYSKSNSRRLIQGSGELAYNEKIKKIYTKNKPKSIKSEKALNWTEYALYKLKTMPDKTIINTCGIDVHCYYSNNRHDLDIELLCDALQKASVIKNDRLLVYKCARKYFDKENPRIVVRVFEMQDGANSIIPLFKEIKFAKPSDVL